MSTRRVVVTHDAAGRSVLTSDGPSPRSKKFIHTPGFATALLWASDGTPTVPHRDGDPTPAVASFAPGIGGTRFMVITFAPDSVMGDPSFDLHKAIAEHLAESPGIADKFEPDAPGMHTTDTIDYGIVLEGEIWLELDDQKTIHLKQHDVTVLAGARHAWRNKSQKPTTIAFVLVGAQRAAAGNQRG